MRRVSDLLFRLRAILARGRMQRELDEEVAFHLEMETRKYVEQGLDPADARRRALRAFGGVEARKEWTRDAWGVSLVQDLAGDVRYALRQLRRSPAFTGVTMLTLALGIGGATAIFSLVNGILLQPLSYNDSGRIVAIWPATWHSKPFFQYLEQNASSYEAIAGWAPRGHVLIGDAGAEQLWGPRVTASFFDVLGPDLALGRAFAAGEDRGAADVVVLSYGFWRRHFGADPGVIGTRIDLRGSARTIIGVMSSGYDFLQPDAGVAVLQRMEEGAPGWGYRELKLIGRLAPGVTRQQAEAELRGLAAGWREEHGLPDDWAVGASVTSLRADLVGGVRPVLLLLFAAVGLVLLIATANVASLLLARALSRRREVGLRLALGAGPWRLARQLLTESTLLGLLGGALGLGAAILGLRALVAVLPPETPRLDDVRVSGLVLAFSVGLALVTGWVVGLGPTLRSIQADLRNDLDAGGRGLIAPRGRGGVRAGIVVGQVALAVVLLSASGLLVKSFWLTTRVDPGFRPDGLFAFDLVPEAGRIDSAAQIHAYYGLVRDRLEAIPGVTAEAEINAAPFRSDGWIMGYYPEDNPPSGGAEPPIGRWRPVTPGYFRALGVTLLGGRVFTESDRADGQQVAVISRGAAHQLFGDQDPVGRRIVVGLENNEPVTVVGVVGDVMALGLDQESPAVVYRPYAQVDAAVGRVIGGSRAVLLRTDAEVHGLATQVRGAVRSVDPNALVRDFVSLPTAIAGSLAQRRSTMIVVSLFTVTALILGTVGVYGVMAYRIRERGRELAIRVALGASSGDVFRDVLLSGLTIAGVGTAIGLALALALSRSLEGFVFHIPTQDPWVLAGAAALSVGAALLASYRPARRAGRADPVEALSSD